MKHGPYKTHIKVWEYVSDWVSEGQTQTSHKEASLLWTLEKGKGGREGIKDDIKREGERIKVREGEQQSEIYEGWS